MVPPLMRPAATSIAPCQMIIVIDPSIRKITIAVIKARRRIRLLAVAKTRSTASASHVLALLLVERLDDPHRAEDFAVDRADVGDPVLAAPRDRPNALPEQGDRHDHEQRSEQDQGASFGASARMIMQAKARTRLRSATETVVPTTCSMIVVSTVTTRDVISAGRFSSKKPGDRRSRLR